MYELDERMVEMIFDYCRKRLALDPVSLDFGGSRESFDAVLSGPDRGVGQRPRRRAGAVRRSPGDGGRLV